MALHLFLPALAESGPETGGLREVALSKGPEITKGAPGGAEQAT